MSVSIADRVEEIASWFLGQEQLAELRALNLPRARAKSAYFHLPDQAEAMAQQALAWEEEGAKGIYWAFNPIRDDMAQARTSARDADVAGRRWVLIDIDPIRPANTCSTAAEKELAWCLAQDTAAGLQSLGWSLPVLADSGNGYHLLYPIDLPNNEASKVHVQALLKGLDRLLSNEQVKIDTSVFNAARIVRVWGTLTRKGENTSERPWRYSRLLTDPGGRERAARQNSQALVDTLRRWAWIEEQRTGRPARDPARDQVDGQAMAGASAIGGPTVGDDFDARATWAEVLEPHGWKADHTTPDGTTHWTRPGKGEGTSATTGHCTGGDGADLLYVFSDAAEPFEPGQGYGKFRAFALLTHAGDHAAAAKDLAARGYGEPAEDRKKRKASLAGGEGRPRTPQPPVTAAEILSFVYEEPPCVVSRLVPIGLTLLAGRPKQGKSWLALQMSVATVQGSHLLGQDTLQGDVLYLAMEDHARRIQSRLKKMLGEPPYSQDLARLSFLFASGVEAGDLDPVRAWAKAAARPRLVVLDTLGRFMPARRREGDSYQADYAFMSELQKVAFETGLAFVVVHHTRKVSSEDPLTEVSGSTAYTGAADAVLVLRRNPHHADASLEITGRDIEEQSLKVQWSDGTWVVGGDGHTPGAGKKSGPPPEKLQAATDWLRAQLAAGPRKVKDLLDEAEQLDEPIGKGTFFNARSHLISTGQAEQFGDRPKYIRLTVDNDDARASV